MNARRSDANFDASALVRTYITVCIQAHTPGSNRSSNQSREGEIQKTIIKADLVDCMIAPLLFFFLAIFSRGMRRILTFEDKSFREFYAMRWRKGKALTCSAAVPHR
jgi:hypothetical protein